MCHTGVIAGTFFAHRSLSLRGSHTPLLHLGRYIASSAALWRLEMVRYRQPARLLSFVACLRAARLARESHFARRDEKERGAAATGTRYTRRTQQACACLCIIPYRSLYSCVRHAYAHSKLLLLFGDAKTASQRTVEQPVLQLNKNPPLHDVLSAPLCACSGLFFMFLT